MVRSWTRRRGTSRERGRQLEMYILCRCTKNSEVESEHSRWAYLARACLSSSFVLLHLINILMSVSAQIRDARETPPRLPSTLRASSNSLLICVFNMPTPHYLLGIAWNSQDKNWRGRRGAGSGDLVSLWGKCLSLSTILSLLKHDNELIFLLLRMHVKVFPEYGPSIAYVIPRLYVLFHPTIHFQRRVVETNSQFLAQTQDEEG